MNDLIETIADYLYDTGLASLYDSSGYAEMLINYLSERGYVIVNTLEKEDI